MELQKVEIDDLSVRNTNYQHIKRIEGYKKFIAKYEEDKEIDDRHKSCECVFCYKSSRIGGAAVSSRECSFCEKLLHSGNTNIDLLCVDCAKQYSLCKSCGADIDLIERKDRF